MIKIMYCRTQRKNKIINQSKNLDLFRSPSLNDLNDKPFLNLGALSFFTE